MSVGLGWDDGLYVDLLGGKLGWLYRGYEGSGVLLVYRVIEWKDDLKILTFDVVLDAFVSELLYFSKARRVSTFPSSNLFKPPRRIQKIKCDLIKERSQRFSPWLITTLLFIQLGLGAPFVKS